MTEKELPKATKDIMDRDFLIALEAQIAEERDIVQNEYWKNALTQLLIAVDHLDAMIARCTVYPCSKCGYVGLRGKE